MNDWAEFGDKSRFEIAVRWTDDPEPRARRPAYGGWSTGQLRLTVNHHVLTRNETSGTSTNAVTWYLLPVFEWISQNWISLLHEERFAWRENSGAPAATAAFLALRRSIDVDDNLPSGDNYGNIQAWWARHALRAADGSALFPDVVFRRLGDEIEISWTARQPSHLPDGFRFSLMPGVATLPVSAVAGPLWEALNWVGAAAPTPLLTVENKKSIVKLEHRLKSLKRLPASTMEAGYLPDRLFSALSDIRHKIHLPDKSKKLKDVPALEALDDAVLMFGGVSPDIGRTDMNTLLALLSSRAGGQESASLQALVDSTVGAPAGIPFQEGYDLAERLLDECSLPGSASYVDVRALVIRWGVKIIERVLKTNTIRGVAIAGARYAPTILINKTSEYNANEVGRRFTLAHELFHILYDRSLARRVSHVSGPWAPPGVEKRANAFAAMFLMPRSLLARSFHSGQIDEKAVTSAAGAMQVGISALVEHLYNTSMIDEVTRDRLRLLEAATRPKNVPMRARGRSNSY
jgi:Zn-dependent peptidase ImmA (M78 family)